MIKRKLSVEWLDVEEVNEEFVKTGIKEKLTFDIEGKSFRILAK